MPMMRHRHRTSRLEQRSVGVSARSADPCPFNSARIPVKATHMARRDIPFTSAYIGFAHLPAPAKSPAPSLYILTMRREDRVGVVCAMRDECSRTCVSRDQSPLSSRDKRGKQMQGGGRVSLAKSPALMREERHPLHQGSPCGVMVC